MYPKLQNPYALAQREANRSVRQKRDPAAQYAEGLAVW